MNNKYSELKEQLDYIPYIEYNNNINDTFETNIIQINTNSLLYLPNLSPKNNKSESKSESNKSKSESDYILCKKFKEYLCKLFI